MKGIDVSKHQGSINWTAVKNAGIEFAILRAGYGMYESQFDPTFESNYSGCKAAGIPCGAYWYSYAVSPEEAVREADLFVRALSGKQFEFPVYLDIEDNSQAPLGKDRITQICIAFCERLEQAGYFAGIYANTNWFSNYIDRASTDRFTKWLADYREVFNTSLPRDIHQYTSSGSVSGIAGRVDQNTCTRDFPGIIRSSGRNGFSVPVPEPIGPTTHVWITGQKVNIRQSPNGPVLFQSNIGGQADMISEENGWANCDINGARCYISRQYLATREEWLGHGYCTGERVNLRSGPGIGFPVIGQISQSEGAELDVICESQGWYYCDINGFKCYVSSQYVQIQ